MLLIRLRSRVSERFSFGVEHVLSTADLSDLESNCGAPPSVLGVGRVAGALTLVAATDVDVLAGPVPCGDDDDGCADEGELFVSVFWVVVSVVGFELLEEWTLDEVVEWFVELVFEFEETEVEVEGPLSISAFNTVPVTVGVLPV